VPYACKNPFVFLSSHVLDACGLLPSITAHLPGPVVCMTAFQLDGLLVPLQKPVALKKRRGIGRGYRLLGWPRRSILQKGCQVCGIAHMLPATTEPSTAGDVPDSHSSPHIPGLLVIQLRSNPGVGMGSGNADEGEAEGQGGVPDEGDLEEGGLAAAAQQQQQPRKRQRRQATLTASHQVQHRLKAVDDGEHPHTSTPPAEHGAGTPAAELGTRPALEGDASGVGNDDDDDVDDDDEEEEEEVEADDDGHVEYTPDSHHRRVFRKGPKGRGGRGRGRGRAIGGSRSRGRAGLNRRGGDTGRPDAAVADHACQVQANGADACGDGAVIAQSFDESLMSAAPQTPATPPLPAHSNQEQQTPTGSAQPQQSLQDHWQVSLRQQQQQQQQQPHSLAKRVAWVMQRLLDSSTGPVSKAELVGVLDALRSQAAPEAQHLADVMASVPVGSSMPEPQRSALTSAVFKWQVASL
jgi:hypothetical protein